jgi:hypothetical protein
VAELLVRSRLYPDTVAVAVRFGNVLGSRGSVIPHFQQQIRDGGPLTVTHREIKRYFMTIPEASGLVIQAGAMGKGREIFVLDMGAREDLGSGHEHGASGGARAARHRHNRDWPGQEKTHQELSWKARPTRPPGAKITCVRGGDDIAPLTVELTEAVRGLRRHPAALARLVPEYRVEGLPPLLTAAGWRRGMKARQSRGTGYSDGNEAARTGGGAMLVDLAQDEILTSRQAREL